MPLITSIDHGTLGTTYLWRISEEQAYFIDELNSTGIDLHVIDGWHPNRQKEWLTGRHLVHTYIDHPIINMSLGTQGKPYFADKDLHFSISHSGKLVALTKSTSVVGIDLQLTKPKMDKLAHKFVNDDELNLLQSNWSLLQKQHLIWCAKEAMFKAYGEGQVDFRQHMSITAVANEKGDYYGKLENGKASLEFLIRHRMIGDAHLVHAWQQ